MAGSSGSPSPAQPKILLAKPGLVTTGPVAGKYGRGGGEDETASHRSRLPPIGSVNLVNTDFTVIGVIGPTGVGKSTILNEIYGFDGTSPGMLPPFTVQSEDVKASARHSTLGIEPRVSAERIILLDTQPVFCPSVLAEMMRPDGSSTIPVLSGESLSAELAHELMTIQLGVLLASICNIVLVVCDGVHDDNMWRLMSTVDLLKHGIPDPSSLSPSHSQSSNIVLEKENVTDSEVYMATPVFVHTKLGDEENTPHVSTQLKKTLEQYFCSSSFTRKKDNKNLLDMFLIPSKQLDDSPRAQYESYISALSRIRDQVLSMKGSSFGRSVSEREWLKNSAKIWEMVKSSPIIAEYSATLEASGFYRR
ncbi:hypothetical protein ACFE04_028476 [Oxalis oulophora]